MLKALTQIAYEIMFNNRRRFPRLCARRKVSSKCRLMLSARLYLRFASAAFACNRTVITPRTQMVGEPVAVVPAVGAPFVGVAMSADPVERHEDGFARLCGPSDPHVRDAWCTACVDPVVRADRRKAQRGNERVWAMNRAARLSPTRERPTAGPATRRRAVRRPRRSVVLHGWHSLTEVGE